MWFAITFTYAEVIAGCPDTAAESLPNETYSWGMECLSDTSDSQEAMVRPHLVLFWKSGCWCCVRIRGWPDPHCSRVMISCLLLSDIPWKVEI